MSDPALTQELLANIITAIERIERRFVGISDPGGFVIDDDGLDRLDGITMMLIAMGEQLKRLEKAADIDLSARYPEVDWKGAKSTRDFLSHHYFLVDAEIIYDICSNLIGGVKDAILSLQLEYDDDPEKEEND
jgi:uncharacterized protein with HEPN domain